MKRDKMFPHVKENFDINLLVFELQNLFIPSMYEFIWVFLDCDKIVILWRGNNGTFCLTYNFGKIIDKYAVINSQVSH